MLLGKRPRPHMKRTTSLSEISFDLETNVNSTHTQPGAAAAVPSDPFMITQRQAAAALAGDQQPLTDQHRFLAATVSPRTLHRRASADFLETAPFLKTCHLCNRRLVPSRDIYMYRGDSAFCSLECRQQQMSVDERKEKCSLASKKESTASTTTSSEVSTKGETVAAV
ncbi:hypothetical protein Tsubulata_048938 [Turnera subulata]|uniref:FLZ-type domain-containing protein n=1 Tax=Turnera subulata TaxID=218843 RepID=A0A9Q0GM56_9ROSI|nr:hypothetical protein Tsubulata_048938 [Turnera subulata]